MPSLSEQVRLTLRPATRADIPVLRDLAERTWRVAYGAMLPAGQVDYMLGRMYAPAQIERELAEGVAWEIAEAGDMAAGFFSVTFEEGGSAKLNKLYVLPEHQGCGIGHALLSRAQELAADRGAHEMWLQVNKRNTHAIRTYERAGFVVERSAVFDIGGGFVMDDFVMKRPLVARRLNDNTSPPVSA